MTNDEFLGLYAMLDGHQRTIGGDHFGLKSLHAGGMILFSRHIRKQLEQWEIEVARRAKAAAEDARSLEKNVRDDFGADAYDKLEPDHLHGLDFGDKPPR